MKKILLLLVLSVVTVCQSFGQNSSVFREFLDAANQACPMDLGAVGSMTSIVYQNGYVVYNISCDENVIDIDKLNSNINQSKQSLIAMVKDPEMKDVLDMLIKENAGLKYCYTCKASGKKAVATLTPGEVHAIANGTIDGGDMSKTLLQMISSANSTMPSEITDGMTGENIVLEGDYVVFNVSVDESKYSIQTLKQLQSEYRSGMAEVMKSSDATYKALLLVIKNSSYGLDVRLKGASSGETMDVKFTASELGKLVND